jgi:hypothetical protein
MRVTQRHKNPGDAPPCLWNRLTVSLYHSYMTSYLVSSLYAGTGRCQLVAEGFRRAVGRCVASESGARRHLQHRIQ